MREFCWPSTSSSGAGLGLDRKVEYFTTIKIYFNRLKVPLKSTIFQESHKETHSYKIPSYKILFIPSELQAPSINLVNIRKQLCMCPNHIGEIC
jgi:hypothetical protein